MKGGSNSFLLTLGDFSWRMGVDLSKHFSKKKSEEINLQSSLIIRTMWNQGIKGLPGAIDRSHFVDEERGF